MSSTTLPVPLPTANVPLLIDGDRLSRAEFERRYLEMPENAKAELIDGVVYMASPTHFEVHGRPDYRLITWTGYYQFATPGVNGAVNTTVRLDLKNEPQPDSVLFILPAFGGQVSVSDDDYIENAPDLVIEIAASSVSIDLGPKLRNYARCGVREYVVWRTLDGAIDWFAIRNGVHTPIVSDQLGVLRSEAFPGLWLDVPAALRLDAASMLATLQKGLQSPEHAKFVADLQARRKA